MGVAYAAFYMAWYNVAAGNVSSVRDPLGFSSSFMGWVMSAGSWAYAATAPFTGQITDRIGGKNGMVLACFGAASCNLVLGVLFSMDSVSPTLEKALFIILYAGNELVQGFGTSAVVKINAAWYAANERGLFAGVFNIMLTSGYFLSLGARSWRQYHHIARLGLCLLDPWCRAVAHGVCDRVLGQEHAERIDARALRGHEPIDPQLTRGRTLQVGADEAIAAQ